MAILSFQRHCTEWKPNHIWLRYGQKRETLSQGTPQKTEAGTLLGEAPLLENLRGYFLLYETDKATRSIFYG